MQRVYLISSGTETKQYKIGYTRREAKKRIKEFKTGNSNNLEVLFEFESKWASKIEVNLHKKFKEFQINGEWFELPEIHINRFYEECRKQHEMFEILSNENSYVIERGGIK